MRSPLFTFPKTQFENCWSYPLPSSSCTCNLSWQQSGNNFWLDISLQTLRNTFELWQRRSPWLVYGWPPLPMQNALCPALPDEQEWRLRGWPHFFSPGHTAPGPMLCKQRSQRGVQVIRPWSRKAARLEPDTVEAVKCGSEVSLRLVVCFAAPLMISDAGSCTTDNNPGLLKLDTCNASRNRRWKSSKNAQRSLYSSRMLFSACTCPLRKTCSTKTKLWHKLNSKLRRSQRLRRHPETQNMERPGGNLGSSNLELFQFYVGKIFRKTFIFHSSLGKLRRNWWMAVHFNEPRRVLRLFCSRHRNISHVSQTHFKKLKRSVPKPSPGKGQVTDCFCNNAEEKIGRPLRSMLCCLKTRLGRKSGEEKRVGQENGETKIVRPSEILRAQTNWALFGLKRQRFKQIADIGKIQGRLSFRISGSYTCGLPNSIPFTTKVRISDLAWRPPPRGIMLSAVFFCTNCRLVHSVVVSRRKCQTWRTQGLNT